MTTTRESSHEVLSFEVIRRPSISQLLKLVRWSEVFVHNNISLQTGWPLLLARRPWVVAHHTWIARTDSSLGLRDRLEHWLTRFATNIAVSRSNIVLKIEASESEDASDLDIVIEKHRSSARGKRITVEFYGQYIQFRDKTSKPACDL